MVIGVIDCTHIWVMPPGMDEMSYVNRKLFHSINVQAITDINGKFINMVANWPGTTHDSFILKY